MNLHVLKIPRRNAAPHIFALRLWPFSLALAVWTRAIEDWRIWSIGPDPFV